MDTERGFEQKEEPIVSQLWRRWRRLLFHHVLHADDTPHQIALGVGIGVFIAILPLVGIQMMVAVAIAAALRANKAVCVPLVWITNPVTMGPIYAGCWSVGAFLTGTNPSSALEGFLADVHAMQGWNHVFEADFWSALFHLMLNVGTDLWIGCAAIGLLLAIPSYVVSRALISSHREKRLALLKVRLQERAERRHRRQLARTAGRLPQKRKIVTGTA